ncbi:hypothetical protein [Parvibium lacunae]|uniref:Uncharacterized protein n=1 Tax=Parvibium lacunae TaxID=1888893 RepID=A0A368L7Z4_9BURK|nr:hypothetical protein [Parvibium lacunae]RCS59773.1 hypothetical protein DU000_03450 [Parvibium lacunae]
MYIGIVAIGWLYVVTLMALSEHSIAAALGTFIFYGVLPLGILLYLLATPIRQKRRQYQAQLRAQTQATDEAKTHAQAPQSKPQISAVSDQSD